MSNIPDAEDTRKHVVYRCYDADDQLLYIGCTQDLDYRISLHHPLVLKRLALVETEDFPDKVTARVAERDAIKSEAPLLNKEHNPRRFKGKAGGGYVAVEPVHPFTAELVRYSEPVTREMKYDALSKVAKVLGFEKESA